MNTWYYFWCDRYTAVDDPDNEGCKFASQADPTARPLVTNFGPNHAEQIRAYKADLRCTTHGRPPQVFRRAFALSNRLMAVWATLWETRYEIDPITHRRRWNTYSRRPKPLTIRSTWEAAP